MRTTDTRWFPRQADATDRAAAATDSKLRTFQCNPAPSAEPSAATRDRATAIRMPADPGDATASQEAGTHSVTATWPPEALPATAADDDDDGSAGSAGSASTKKATMGQGLLLEKGDVSAPAAEPNPAGSRAAEPPAAEPPADSASADCNDRSATDATAAIRVAGSEGSEGSSAEAAAAASTSRCHCRGRSSADTVTNRRNRGTSWTRS